MGRCLSARARTTTTEPRLPPPTLRLSLRVFLRLFAPFVPFVTDEIWSWSAAAHTGFPSIRRAPWPSPTELDAISAPDDPQSFSFAVAAIGAVRRYMADTQVSVGALLESVVLAGSPEDVVRLDRVQADVALCRGAVRLTLRADARVPRGTFEMLEAKVQEG
jgi:valyl-tRNA synthetase